MAVLRFKDELKLKKHRQRLKKVVVVLVVAIAILAGIFYLAFFAKLLDIRSVIIEGNKRITASDLEATANDWLDSRFFWIKIRYNFLLARLNVETLAGELNGKFVDVDSISFSWPSIHELKISVSERKSAGIWCVIKQNKCFYFDGKGVVYAETGQSSGFLLTMISDYSEREVNLGEIVVEVKMLDAILKAKESLKKIGIEITEINIPAAGKTEFGVTTPFGWRILLDNSTGIISQINAMGQVFDKLSPEEKSKLQYFDLRIQDRIYYK